MNGREILVYLSIEYKGNWDLIFQAIQEKKDIDEEKLKEVIDGVKCSYITILDPEYPNMLKNIYHPPFVLFYYGDISLIQNYEKMISVIGSRNCGEYGTNQTVRLVSKAAQKYVIVSGMAKGIDGIAHRTAIDVGGKTVAVLGTPIDVCYPIENRKLYEDIKKNHLVLSEYYGENVTESKLSSFPMRNRIIAALSKALLVTEAYSKSGTSITINFALQLGREILCIPYHNDEGSECNRLIKEGAVLVETIQDIDDVMECR